MIRPPPIATLFPYTTLFRSTLDPALEDKVAAGIEHTERGLFIRTSPQTVEKICDKVSAELAKLTRTGKRPRSEEHTSELQSQSNLVCRLLLEKKKNKD